MRTVIDNGMFYRDGKFSDGKLYIDGTRFAKAMDDVDSYIDAKDCYVIPGLIDIHFHGCDGVDLCDASVEAIRKMAAYELKSGITTIHPATMTLSEELLSKVAGAAKSFKEEQRTIFERLDEERAEVSNAELVADLAGLYMEGPFVSMEKRGAQNPEHIHIPDADMFRRINDRSGGMFDICALAPETEGAMGFVSQVKDEVRISVAHTTADYDTARRAFDLGADQVTHLYNAMPPFTHRNPGVVGAACESPWVKVELICDGVHIHPSAIRTTFSMFGNNRIIMISDSMRAAGMPDGDYELGGQPVRVCGNRAELKDGTIAGSVTDLFKCMKYVVEQVGIPFEKVIKCVTENPAKAIGVWSDRGSLDVNKYADLLIVDKKFELKAVFLRGQRVL